MRFPLATMRTCGAIRANFVRALASLPVGTRNTAWSSCRTTAGGAPSASPIRKAVD
jgi:hypothetical protein